MLRTLELGLVVTLELGLLRTSSLNPPCKYCLLSRRSERFDPGSKLSRKKKMAREHLNLLLLLLLFSVKEGDVVLVGLVGDVEVGGGLRFVS